MILAALLFVSIPAVAKSITTVSSLSNVVAVADTSFIGKIESKTGVKLPDEYRSACQEFLNKYEILQDEDVIDYTEKFIVEQMKEDLGINKQDQYLFLLSTCFEKCTRDYLYYAADGNDKRLDDYTTVMDKIDQCGDKYEEGLKLKFRK